MECLPCPRNAHRHSNSSKNNNLLNSLCNNSLLSRWSRNLHSNHSKSNL